MISASGNLANRMANSLFMVDSPPLLDPHSEAKMVTCNLRDLSGKDAISKHDHNG